MASSLLPQDLIEKPDNGLMFTILRRSSSTGSLQVPVSSICFDGFVATAVKSPSDQNLGQNPAVKGFVGLEPPKIDSSVPQVENYKDAGGEAVNEDFTATVAHVDSVIVQNLVTVEGSSTTETIQKSDMFCMKLDQISFRNYHPRLTGLLSLMASIALQKNLY
ncbi:unnamed protein product [Brassica rapa]|uniref:Uncharacterized protein n=1 Tax=Brassica campestris TaxID=3711 RepID=A0A8D9LV80_BRACM|nr:unnamed protein product [Brassica rapa]